MSLLTAAGAVCKCSFGAAPCALAPVSAKKTMGGGMPLTTIMDKEQGNLATFGMCNSMANPAVSSATSAALGVLTPQPCAPLIPAPWMAGSPTVFIEGNPVLVDMAKASCVYGGIIEILNPGQQTVQAG